MRVLSVVSLFTLLSGPVVAAPVVFDFANLKLHSYLMRKMIVLFMTKMLTK